MIDIIGSNFWELLEHFSGYEWSRNILFIIIFAWIFNRIYTWVTGGLKRLLVNMWASFPAKHVPKLFQRANGDLPKFAIPEGRVGLPMGIPIANDFLRRIIVAATYDLNSYDRLESVTQTIWEGDAKRKLTGLREWIDRYSDVITVYLSHNSRETIGTPFQHFALLAASSTNAQSNANAAEQGYLDDFALRLPALALPRFKVYTGPERNKMRVFFGYGVYVPADGELPGSEIYIEEKDPEGKSTLYPLVLGYPGPGQQVYAGLYPGQSCLAFSIGQPTTPASAAVPNATPGQRYIFVLTIMDSSQGPELLAYPRSSAADGDDWQPHCSSAIDTDNPRPIRIECCPDGTSGNKIIRGNTRLLEYDLNRYVDHPDHPRDVRLICCPNPAPERIRAQNNQFYDNGGLSDAHFEVNALLLPDPDGWGEQAERIWILVGEKGTIVTDATTPPEFVLSLDRFGRLTSESREGKFATASRLGGAEPILDQVGLRLQPSPQATWQNRPTGRKTEPSKGDVSHGPRLDNYIKLVSRETDHLGYLLNLLYPEFTGNTPAPYPEQSPVSYENFLFDRKREKKRDINPHNGAYQEFFSLGWLDHSIKVEMKGNRGTTELVGYARWCRDHFSRGAEAVLSKRQVMENREGRLHVSDRYSSGHEHTTTLFDDDLLRLGPLELRYRTLQ